jgi:hypothetical protein
MYFDRFDICEAYYLFATDYHGGQWSPEYAIFGRLHRMGFCPGLGGVTYDALTENGKEIYDNLVSKLNTRG